MNMPEEEEDGGEWRGYRRLVLRQLEDLYKAIGEINTKLDNLRASDISGMRTDIELLKQKSIQISLAVGSVSGILGTIVVNAVIKLIS